ncbi:hypothetical protein LINPERPRIM_LOCUS31756, partial [Linum perenne]
MIFWLLLHVQLISICKRNQARRKEKVIYSVPTRLLVKHSQDFHQHIHKLYLQGANCFSWQSLLFCSISVS